MNKDILCTLGPASLNERVIRRLGELGTSLFRINLSHTKLEDLAETIKFIQRHTNVPICLDTEGAQIRTGEFVDGEVMMRENSIVRLHEKRVPGDPYNFNLYPREIIRSFRIADFISIDFDSVLVQVIDFEDLEDRGCAIVRVLNGGPIKQNKAVTVAREIDLPALTEKDRAACALGVEMGVRHFALSFANSAADVTQLRDIVGDDAFIISKIECLRGIANLADIAGNSEALLVDRGDLSREVPIEHIPLAQKQIIDEGHRKGIKVYVATNLLESMVAAPIPTRAEINDIFHTLRDGADGLVLAAETAIGRYPIECTGMVVKMINNMDRQREDGGLKFLQEPVSLLPPPHGGRLIHREATLDFDVDIKRLEKLSVPETIVMDCEQIALGTYSPLTGFMNREALESVLDTNRLPGGDLWTLPMILQVDPDAVKRMSPGDRVALADDSGAVRAFIDIDEIYAIDLDSVANRWFGTTSPKHPGVKRLLAGGDRVLSGDVTLLERAPSPYRPYELTPVQTRFIFAHKGWSKVVGFHTRNVVHRVHHHIQNEALERCAADGLYISPVIGPKKPHDFLPGPVMKGYQILLDFGFYSPGKVVLGSFSTYSRYCGPREAVFTALCRKNMGCSHFIIGRDHTGVGDFYGPDENRKLFEASDDLGIEPVFFEDIAYDVKNNKYVPAGNGGDLRSISGTEARQAILAGKRLPNWFMHDVVQDMLQDEITRGKKLFYP